MKDKLVKVVKSKKPTKKYDAHFQSGKVTSFGAKGMDDFTKSKNVEQKNRYRKRHKKDLKTGDPRRAGYLSYEILWSKPTLREGIKEYKRKYGM